jgi:hypothetical protein
MPRRQRSEPSVDEILGELAEKGLASDALLVAFRAAFLGEDKALVAQGLGSGLQPRVQVARKLVKRVNTAVEQARRSLIPSATFNSRTATAGGKKVDIDRYLRAITEAAESVERAVLDDGFWSVVHAAERRKTPLNCWSPAALVRDLRERDARLSYRKIAILLVRWPPSEDEVWGDPFEVVRERNESVERATIRTVAEAADWLKARVRKQTKQGILTRPVPRRLRAP